MEQIALILITFLAATVNGALGYGFSSITVPVALLFYTNRILNPALVLVEMVINAYVLFINRHSVPLVWKRVLPLVLGVLPGVAIGSYVLFMVKPGWLKFVTYLLLLPLILLQAAGVRRAVRSEKAVGLPFGMGIGVLYSVTTISGPPLALFFNNQGYAKQEFRAALGLIRVAESTLTAAAYFFLGLYSVDSGQLLASIVPSVLIGIPLGTFLISRIDPETFRRLCMSFDAWVVGFGLSKVMVELHLAASPGAYGVLAGVAVIDAYLLFMFFRNRAPVPIVGRSAPRPPTPEAADPDHGRSRDG
ncbi:MAG: sulfite exporter TauE/SafE family protein [Nitrospirae bacterium]|nr:sulfite exporter TauE/SafE family protein [Nitrospirota bacterium]